MTKLRGRYGGFPFIPTPPPAMYSLPHYPLPHQMGHLLQLLSLRLRGHITTQSPRLHQGHPGVVFGLWVWTNIWRHVSIILVPHRVFSLPERCFCSVVPSIILKTVNKICKRKNSAKTCNLKGDTSMKKTVAWKGDGRLIMDSVDLKNPNAKMAGKQLHFYWRSSQFSESQDRGQGYKQKDWVEV